MDCYIKQPLHSVTGQPRPARPGPAPPLLPLMCRALSIERLKAMFSPRLVRMGCDAMECDEMRIEICATCHVIA